MASKVGKISNRVLSVAAGLSAFALTLLGFLLLGSLNQQVAASVVFGLFALTIVYLAAERPNSEHARAVSALIDRLMAVGRGDLASPVPPALKREMPALAAAVEGLFDQVRSNLADAQAMAMYDPVTALPNRVQRENLVTWFRSNVSPHLLISFVADRNLGGGVVVRTPNRVFDFTWKQQLTVGRAKLAEIIRSV